MALTLKNSQVEALAAEVADLTGESKTEAVRPAILERRPKRDIGRFLATHVWPTIPADVLGREVTKAEVEEYLGFGPGGV